MRPKRLRHVRDEKEGNTRVDEFLSDVTSELKQNDVKNAVCFIKHANGEMYLTSSDGNTDEVIGMIEVGKSALVNQRFGDEE